MRDSAVTLVTSRCKFRSAIEEPRALNSAAPTADDEAMGRGRDERRDLAIAELERERDMAIARADEAEERERAAQERLRRLMPLEARIEAAERRALDAERRLEEIVSRVASSDARAEDPTGAEPDELRARLARSAARKKLGGTRGS